MLKIIFAGTPEFAVSTLSALLQSEHQICAVYTQPDRLAGRGQKLTSSPVKQLAASHNIPVYQPTTLRDQQAQQELRDLQADVMVVVAYGLILPKAVLTLPRYGCINVHPSLLPRWRGATPIQSALLAGDTETGVTIMQMDEGMDSGPILKKITYPIGLEETSGTMHDHLAKLGAQGLLDALTELSTNEFRPEPQNNALATYTKKILKTDAQLDWNSTAIDLDCKVRAFNPWPVAYAQWDENIIRIWRAKSLPQKTPAKPGEILQIDKQYIDVGTANGVLRILELQLSGGKRLAVGDFLNAKKDFFRLGKSFN